MIEFGLVGHPLGHSCSEAVHACFGDYDYRLYDMDEAELTRLMSSRAFRGLNVTIPYKKTVMPFCDRLSDAAREIGSVNTLYFRDGLLCGDNTDITGLEDMLARGGISLKGRKVAILGTGGTAVTARYAARKQGAAETVTVSRTGEENYETLVRRHRDTEIIINATPVGMYPHTEEAPVDLTLFPVLRGVADVIYNPAETALLQQAKSLGLPCVGGLWMLARQGLESAKLFLDRDLPRELVPKACVAVEKMLAERNFGRAE